ncbi:hypothetical protein SteCoe_32923 [Stentor coeruleus]|uniref:Uncharacterized protein n=1 Tax=Stentor coeruleus TaxID=5963 RepID=A0A1R2AYB4_9CILI|nr:hypothetical protein SteCoe_32923 [Stentor coeruleus]
MLNLNLILYHEEAHIMMRCTLRYKNYSIICQELCIYDESPRQFTENYTLAELLEEFAGSEKSVLNNFLDFLLKIYQESLVLSSKIYPMRTLNFLKLLMN